MNLKRLIVAAVAVASAAFIAIELRDGWREISDEQLPGAAPVLLAAGLLALGQLVIGEAMVAVPVDDTSAAERRWAFHLTQPAKYIPAGIAQAAGVIAVLVGRGASRVGAAQVWVVHTLSVIVAGGVVGLALSSALDWPWPITVLAVVVPLAVSRPVLRFGLARLGSVVPAVAGAEPPASPALVSCLALNVVGVALHAAGYAVLVDGAGVDATFAAAMAAYGLALGISVATPLPGGLGAREAILLALTADDSTGLVVPIVLVRLLLAAIEVGFWLVASARRPAVEVAG